MAKQLTFQQGVWNGCTINGQEWSITALRVGMQGVGNKLFARTAFACNQNRNVTRRTFADNFIHFLHSLTVPQHGDRLGRQCFRTRSVRGNGGVFRAMFLERTDNQLLQGFDIKGLDQIVVRIKRGRPDGRFG